MTYSTLLCISWREEESCVPQKSLEFWLLLPIKKVFLYQEKKVLAIYPSALLKLGS